MQANNTPNHQQDFTPLQLEFIAKMGTTHDGYAYARSIQFAIEGVFGIKTIYRRMKALKERENITKTGLVPVTTFLKYVSFKNEQFSDIVVE